MSQKRPFLVWVIVIFYGLSAAWTLLSFALVASGMVNISPAEAAYFSSLTLIDYALTILLGVSGVISVIMLFQLRRAALHFFLIALAVNGAYSLWTLLMNPTFGDIRTEMAIGMVIGFGTLCLISFYVYRLKERGLLT